MCFSGIKIRQRAQKVPFAVIFSFFLAEIIRQQLPQKRIPVHTADKAAGVIVIGDVSGVLGKNISHQLINGIVSLYLQRIINGGHDFPHFGFAVKCLKFPCDVFHI